MFSTLSRLHLTVFGLFLMLWVANPMVPLLNKNQTFKKKKKKIHKKPMAISSYVVQRNAIGPSLLGQLFILNISSPFPDNKQSSIK